VHTGPVICLVGMPGSGKSTVGEIVAERLGARFVDLDTAVVDAAGMDVTTIFAAEGEEGFRRRERDALAALVDSGERVVVATGGGVVTTPHARELLARTTCVWLDASRATLIERLANEASSRPLLADDLEASLHRLADERDAHYRGVADHTVATDGTDPDSLADRIVAQVTR